MRKILYTLLLVSVSQWAYAQIEYSYGVYGGGSMPFTYDEGLNRDPRFKSKITFRGSPAGIFFGYSYFKVGFQVGIFYQQIGQQYGIYNIYNGEVGIRDIDMHYVGIPIGIKINFATMRALRLNLLGGLKVGYLAGGTESIGFSASTLAYPKEVLVPDESGYKAMLDGGVATPDVKKSIYVSNDKFNPIQLFAYMGIGGEYRIAKQWYLTLNIKGGYGILETRKPEYINQLKQTVNAPDLYGIRRDFYLSSEIGVTWVITADKAAKKNHSNEPPKRYESKAWRATGKAIQNHKARKKDVYKPNKGFNKNRKKITR